MAGINKERLVNTFIELVKIDSPSFEEGAVASQIKKTLEGLGLEVLEDQANLKCGGQIGNLYAKYPGTIKGNPLLFCLHMDTVEPGRGVKPQIKDGTICTDGTTILGADDKAGIAAVIEVLRVIKEEQIPSPPVEVLFTIAEEQGLVGVQHLDLDLITAQYAYVLDSYGPPGKIVMEAPSQDQVEVTIFGRSAHSGFNPEAGINAIQVAAKAVAGLKLGRIDSESTANIGVIRGGLATNIVPERVLVKGETRSLSDAKRAALTTEMQRRFMEEAQRAGCEVEFEIDTMYPAYRLKPGDEVVKLARTAANHLGLDVELEKSGGGSDANFLNSMGIPTANLSCGMQKVHTTEEYIEIEDLFNTARLVLEIIRG